MSEGSFYEGRRKTSQPLPRNRKEIVGVESPHEKSRLLHPKQSLLDMPWWFAVFVSHPIKALVELVDGR